MRSLAVALSLMALPGIAFAGECKTKEAFRAENADVKPRGVAVAKDNARAIILAEINKARAAAKVPPLDVDEIYIATIANGGDDVIGIVMFKNGCVVPGTVKAATVELWENFLKELGLSMDDFKPEGDA